MQASRGVDGGYQLAAGAALPPLVVDDDEAVALAVGMQAATQGSVAGIEESAVRALTKVVQVMPPRLRRRVEARYGCDVWQVLDVADTAPRVRADVLVVHDVDDREVPVGEGLRVARAFGREPVLTTGLGHGRVLVDDDVATRVLAPSSSSRGVGRGRRARVLGARSRGGGTGAETRGGGGGE